MPYYKNKEDFIQPITISGKRFLVKPGQVINCDRELDLSIYSFLEVTTEKNSSSPTPFISNQPDKKMIAGVKLVEQLSQKINNFSKDVQSLKDTISEITQKIKSSVTREQLLGLINTVLKDTPQIEPEELNLMANDVKELKEELTHLADNNTVVQISEKLIDISKIVDENTNQTETLQKRIEILKKVVQNLENVVYDIVTNSNNNVIDDEVIVIENINEEL